MGESPTVRKLADLSRQELCTVGREYLLIGHLQDRVGLPMATKLVGEDAQLQLSIDEWMGASPIYSVRMQKALHFEGNDVATVFKNLQLEIGAPHQFMDFQFRLDRPDSGEFWLPHCGALLDVEPFGEKRVKRMCHDIEDPTFDATAAATHPCMKMRPIHRPPRIPTGRYPHCAWQVFIDGESQPYEQHPNLPAMQATRIAQIPIEVPDADREPGGWADYSGDFDPGFQLEDLSHRALLIVCQEAAVQAHLLARSFLLNVDQRHGRDSASELGRAQWIGAAGVGAYRLRKALDLDGSLESIATVFELHPHFQPRTYVDFNVERTNDATLRLSIRDCPALDEADHHSWFGALHSQEPSAAIQTIAALVNPKARCRRIDAEGARFAWEVVIDEAATDLEEPIEMKMARYSRGVDFELMQRRTLRT